MVIGFNNDNKGERQEFYKPYLGKVGHYGVGSISATGVLRDVNLREMYIEIQPSIVGIGDKARIENDLPTRITIVNGQPIVLRPLQAESDLQDILFEHNLKCEKK